MHFLIDGYNLLFRVSSVLDDFSAGRESIIQDLNRKAQRLKMNLTVVFDAQGTPGDAYRTHYQQLEILFSGAQETADDLIIKVLKAQGDCSQYTVVTSDNRLAWRARRAGAKTESVDEFLIKLNKQYLNALRKVNKRIIPPLKEPVKVERVLEEASPSECFDYYLEIFEKSVPFQEPKEKKIIENDLDRWLRIFEEKLRENGA